MSEAAATAIIEVTGPTQRQLLIRRILGHNGLLISSATIVLILLMAVFAPLLSPYDPYQQDLTQRLIPPFWYERGDWAHPLGTDNLGRDYVTRVIYVARISLLVGFAVMALYCLI